MVKRYMGNDSAMLRAKLARLGTYLGDDAMGRLREWSTDASERALDQFPDRLRRGTLQFWRWNRACWAVGRRGEVFRFYAVRGLWRAVA